jgi:flagellin
VSYDAATTGRLRFTNGQGNTYSQFSITFTLKDAAGQTQTISGSTRSPNIYHPSVGVSTSGAELGNSLTSITGSTFDTGTFEITVSDATSAQQRTLSTTYAFTDALGAAVSLGSNIAGSRLFNGTTTLTLSTGNTADFTGTNPDGTTFSGTITFVAVDTGVGQGDATTFQDLIDELNHPDRTDTFYGWTNATATLVSGEIQLIDDIAATSSTAFQMVVNATSGTAVDDGVVVYSGNGERATISIAGGEAQTVDAGSVVTLEGVESTVPGRTYQVTFRVGENLFDGSDDLAVTAQEYTARLNNGPAVIFRNGDQGVVVTDGLNPTGNVAGAQQIKLDFDTILGVTADAAAGGEKFTLETAADRLNFHIGPDEDEYRQFAFFDVRSTNLGLSAGNRLADINVTTITGAENAIEVVDAALDQLNLVNSVVGSLESRMQDTSGDLALYSLNLQNAETTIASADVAKETTELVMNYILVNSQTSALVQATLIPKTVFSILAGHQLP